MKTILTVLREQDMEGQTIGEALGGYLIAEAIEGMSSEESDGDVEDGDTGETDKEPA